MGLCAPTDQDWRGFHRWNLTELNYLPVRNFCLQSFAKCIIFVVLKTVDLNLLLHRTFSFGLSPLNFSNIVNNRCLSLQILKLGSQFWLLSFENICVSGDEISSSSRFEPWTSEIHKLFSGWALCSESHRLWTSHDPSLPGPQGS